MKFFSCAAVFSAFVYASTPSYAATFTLDISGTVNGSYGTSAAASPFEVGERFYYSVTLDDGLSGPKSQSTSSPAEAIVWDYSNVSDFSFSVGSYEAAGSTGGVGLYNDREDQFILGGNPYDGFSLNHSTQVRYDKNGSTPSRTDFSTISGPVVGLVEPSMSFAFQTSGSEIVGEGDSLKTIVQKIQANPNLYTYDLSTGGGLAFVDFFDSTGSSVPLQLDLKIDLMEIDAVLVPEPLSFGTATAAIVTTRAAGGPSAVQNYTTSNNDEFDVGIESSVLSTIGGLAVARADISVSSIEGGVLVGTGLEVGALASGAGETGKTASRGLAFRTYNYEGDDPLSVKVNNLLSGDIENAPFGLPIGNLSAGGGIYIFDALIFSDAISGLGGDLNDILFPLAGKNTDSVEAQSLVSMSAIDLLGITSLAQLEFSEIGTGSRGITDELVFSLGLAGGQSFTVLYDIWARADVTCFDGCGAGSVDFLSTLKSAPNFFTDEFGNVVNSIVPLSNPEISAVPLPANAILLLSALGLFGGAAMRRRAISRRI